ncbi:MAG: PadR family transcriptional regulator [Micromonosporaceae bacterium]|nr:PadR family transcriptional regulator [Micromonosporaceae bacterium]
MSVRHGLLALLERGPRYGYQLRAEFERTTGGTWPLNIGQVYTTLARLERDGLVRALPESDGGQRPYEITPAGRAELALWFASPIERGDRPRDELAIKLALALTTPGVDVRAVVQTQRTATMRTLQELTRLKSSDPGGREDLAWRLVLESMVFQAEAEVRWLDHCEASLARFAADPRALNQPASEPGAPHRPPSMTEYPTEESTVDETTETTRGTR